MKPDLDEAFFAMILSASGWRGIFAESGEEESSSRSISEAHKIIAAVAAKVFADYITGIKGAVIVGMDTRPTGNAIADAIIRSLLSSGRDVRYTGVAAAPEIMAFARASASQVAGFMYISASHNPIGHNGIKFGLTDGGVLQADETAKLVSSFKSFMVSQGRIKKALALLEPSAEATSVTSKKYGSPPVCCENKEIFAEKVSAVYASEKEWKKAALSAYHDFAGVVISGFGEKARGEDFFTALRNGLEKRPLGIVADFNGSARTVSIDRDFLCSFGAGFRAQNELPGEIAHRIVPEGESLEPCRQFLENIHGKDPSFVLGYVPDCDGDRGNLVIAGKEQTRILEAQEVFALSCVAELSYLVWAGELKFDSSGKSISKAALAVNDPTSLRIDRIAQFFGASVHRAEVGEANVVGLARNLREQGYLVRILGEGSAGGTIIHPSGVRDPIATIGAILKLLVLRTDTCPGLFEIWCNLSNQKEIYCEDFSLSDIIASLPAFFTTGAYSEDALLKVRATNHGLLKDNYQKIFLDEWEEKKIFFMDKYGISGWEAIAYNGMEERHGITRFGEAGRGGLKIEFKKNDSTTACIWMRGSGTEPVFRVMAEAEDQDLERFLINWQRQMVQKADN
ncbi:MAG: phosphatidylglycerol lysyltransferase [Treponema sp.]|jgi:phosphoglucomutase|nr:phosphatidylglycerol lysyltransferase [Treponema sp.]